MGKQLQPRKPNNAERPELCLQLVFLPCPACLGTFLLFERCIATKRKP